MNVWGGGTSFEERGGVIVDKYGITKGGCKTRDISFCLLGMVLEEYHERLAYFVENTSFKVEDGRRGYF